MIHNRNHEKAFTLMELLIVISIIAIMAGIAFAGHILDDLKKGRDSKRKQDLNKMLRVLEDYYNDKSRYPDFNPDGNIAGAAWGQAFLPYVPQLPKDQLSPRQNYYYITDPNNPQLFAIYAILEFTKDPDIPAVGCDNGCGPGAVYNYVVHSPNTVLINGNLQSNTLSASPTPTSTIAPTPTQVPGTCGHMQCCPNAWCGAFTFPPGWQCSANGVCYYDTNFSRWTCGDPGLLGVPCP